MKFKAYYEATHFLKNVVPVQEHINQKEHKRKTQKQTI